MTAEFDQSLVDCVHICFTDDVKPSTFSRRFIIGEQAFLKNYKRPFPERKGFQIVELKIKIFSTSNKLKCHNSYSALGLLAKMHFSNKPTRHKICFGA